MHEYRQTGKRSTLSKLRYAMLAVPGCSVRRSVVQRLTELSLPALAEGDTIIVTNDTLARSTRDLLNTLDVVLGHAPRIGVDEVSRRLAAARERFHSLFMQKAKGLHLYRIG